MISASNLGQAQAWSESLISIPQTEVVSQDTLNLFGDDFPTKPIMPSRPLWPGHVEVQATQEDMPAMFEPMDEKVYSHPRV